MNYNALFQHPEFAEKKHIVFFGNQSSYDFQRGAYLFDLLIQEHRLLRMLAPEHGLFSEMQDQIGKDSHTYRGVECRSLYDSAKLSVLPDVGCFIGADALLVDIPDVGARYFTYTTHLFWLLQSLSDNGIDLPVFIIDRPNPAGTKVEGTRLPERYASFVGLPGLLHRHGMSTGQLAAWMLGRLSSPVRVFTIPYPLPPGEILINPSPNIPQHSTIQVYPGQCFWEATTWSEGRGTTRPFEVVGHPDLSWTSCIEMAAAFHARFAGQALLRPLVFIPFFHKHEGRECRGFQWHLLDGAAYHTIFGTLYLMRMARERMSEGEFWRPGSYEFDSECTAAQILIGDDVLIGYVNGEVSEAEVLMRLEAEEKAFENQ